MELHNISIRTKDWKDIQQGNLKEMLILPNQNKSVPNEDDLIHFVIGKGIAVPISPTNLFEIIEIKPCWKNTFLIRFKNLRW